MLGPDQAEVQVRDQGCGFGGNQARAFESFFSTKANGMGLGLSISHAIIHAHGGLAWARDNPAGGAIVAFSLPLLAAGCMRAGLACAPGPRRWPRC
ncbi:hypothetical protein LP420_35680 [Massilia sp. B-10]|nr:hypothetical protein LP420_35680 [Massilia sp. B-10]